MSPREMETGPGPGRQPLEQAVSTVTEAAPPGTFRLVVLFGSAARAEGGARDLDVAVLCADTPDLVALTNSFTRALGYQAVDLVDLGRADPLLAMHVVRDGIALHEEPPGSSARWAPRPPPTARRRHRAHGRGGGAAGLPRLHGGRTGLAAAHLSRRLPPGAPVIV